MYTETVLCMIVTQTECDSRGPSRDQVNL